MVRELILVDIGSSKLNDLPTDFWEILATIIDYFGQIFWKFVPGSPTAIITASMLPLIIIALVLKSYGDVLIREIESRL